VSKKIKILTLSDHPLSPSGVGTQTKYMIEGMLKTGKYQFICVAGAMKHHDYTVQRVATPWSPEEDWIIHPVDGYGTQEFVRSLIRVERPDIVWIMTDPRFWGWLWHIDQEVRSLMPLIYYHVWDNTPYPEFNKRFYESNDLIVTISKVTDNIIKTVVPKVESIYLPHAADSNIFKKLPKEEVQEFRNKSFPGSEEQVLFFWNNRNARRKQSGSLIFWFKEFLDIVGKDKARLIMHTEVKDQHGQDLEEIIRFLGIDKGEVMFSEKKIPPEILSRIYNAVDCTINVSDAEGFGLATLESLACGTPIIVNMTGGLQEQVTDGKKWFGIGLEPTSKAIIGSQDIPWIYEDRLSKEVVVDALLKMYNMSTEERNKLGDLGMKHVAKNYNFENYAKKWDEVFTHACDKYGSWENRKNYQAWSCREVA
jgi:glycosyltransferase involved in cell wall biosynthesis